MRTKVCFKCGIEKPIDKFYKHSKMSDGHLNKCIECSKRDSTKRYFENIRNNDWAEKERVRAREKYLRLNYKNKYKKEHGFDDNIYKSLHKNVEKKNNIDLKGKEIHHWDYNNLLSVFILHRKQHRKIHKYLKMQGDNVFVDIRSGMVLDTKEKHLEYMKDVIKQYNEEFICEDIELNF